MSRIKIKEKRFIYNSEERILSDNGYISNIEYVRHFGKKLSKIEGKLLMLLSDNETHTFEEICKYLYGLEVANIKKLKGKTKIIDRKTATMRVRVMICKLARKIHSYQEIKFYNRKNIGFFMTGEIYIE